MTFKKLFVKQKLDAIFTHTERAKKIFKFSDKKIRADFTKLHTAERLLQLIVDEMLDINQHFIRELDLEIPDDFQSTFYTLGESKVLPLNFSKKIAPVVGMRNRLVHRYEKLNKDIFIREFRRDISDFEKYMKIINVFLEKNK